MLAATTAGATANDSSFSVDEDVVLRPLLLLVTAAAATAAAAAAADFCLVSFVAVLARLFLGGSVCAALLLPLVVAAVDERVDLVGSILNGYFIVFICL